MVMVNVTMSRGLTRRHVLLTAPLTSSSRRTSLEPWPREGLDEVGGAARRTDTLPVLDDAETDGRSINGRRDLAEAAAVGARSGHNRGRLVRLHPLGGLSSCGRAASPG